MWVCIIKSCKERCKEQQVLDKRPTVQLKVHACKWSTDRPIYGRHRLPSVFSYHRWHSPVDGTVAKAYVQDGTYYSDPLIEFAEGLINPVTAVIDSQPYLSEVATRALVFIEADNPDIGLMCFMAIGMVDVSTCDITVYEGQTVKKASRQDCFTLVVPLIAWFFDLAWSLIFSWPNSRMYCKRYTN